MFELEDFCNQKGITLTSDIFCDKQTDRNKTEILKELQFFKERGVVVIILEIPTTQQDYSHLGNGMAKMIMETINNMLIEMYTVFAQVEIEKKEKRQREGIAAKKLRGEWDDYGRPAAMDYKTFAAAYARVERGKLAPTLLRRELELSHSTFYRYRAQYLKANIQE